MQLAVAIYLLVVVVRVEEKDRGTGPTNPGGDHLPRIEDLLPLVQNKRHLESIRFLERSIR